jgi:hypothetical protein
LFLNEDFKKIFKKWRKKVMGMSGEATWRICMLTTIPYINHKNTSSQEPEAYAPDVALQAKPLHTHHRFRTPF